MVKTRRQQQTEETKEALLRAGRKLFGKRGFSDSSAEDIVAQARVTRGALYHHFPNGKPGLFEAVARNLQAELVEAMSAAAQEANDPWLAMEAAISAYFDFADDRSYQQITLQDAPAVIGAEQWRSIEHEYSLRFIERGLEELMDSGKIRKLPIPALASILFGACCEATLSIAAARKPQTAKSEAIKIVLHLVKGLRPTP